MYITISNIKKSLGKYVEMNDLYIGLPILFIFLILFTCTDFKIFSLVFLTTGIFLMLPIMVSKKNRMYKVLILLISYIFKKREYIYSRRDEDNNWKQKIKMKKSYLN